MRNLMTFVTLLLASAPAFASEGGDTGNAAIAAGATIAIAAVGGAIAQGKAASVALEGIARNPAASDKLFTPMIIALALIESLVIYAFVIAFLVKP